MISVAIILAVTIFAIYNVVAIGLFGVPHSLSMTYYLYKNNYNKGWLFPLMMTIVVALLLPSWITISEGSTYQFLSFLAPASLMFVAAAPAFLNDGMESIVHSGAAYFAAACSLLWIILVTPYWWTILLWAVVISITAVCSKTVKSSKIYWLELIAFVATLESILLWVI